MKRTLRLGRVAKRSIKAFSEDDMTTHAAALAYQTFFLLFPFALFLVALLGLLRLPELFDALLVQARVVLPGQAAEAVEQGIEQIRDQAGRGVLSFGIVVTLWSASAAVRMAMHALNVAYNVEEERPAWRRYSLSILYTVLVAVLAVSASGFMLIGPQAASWLAEQVGIGSLFVVLWAWLRVPVAVLLLVVLVALVYYLFPNTGQPFRFITPGALLAVIGWLAASLGFSFYVSNFADYSATYGSLGAVIVLLLYLFISAAVLLFGAEVNAELRRQIGEGKEE